MRERESVEALCARLDAMTEGAARVPVLIELLAQGGHDRHEDIVFELGLIGDPAAIDGIAQAAEQPWPDLEQWGNLREFQRKCAYALARIGTAGSRAALERLTASIDPHLRAYGAEGLAH